VSVVVVFGVGVNIGAETAVVGVSFLGVLTAVFSILRIKSPSLLFANWHES
jgi:hypothetical protein